MRVKRQGRFACCGFGREGYGMRNFTFFEGTVHRLCALTLVGAMAACMTPAYAFADNGSADAQQADASSDGAVSGGDSSADQNPGDGDASADSDEGKCDSSSAEESGGESSGDSGDEGTVEHAIASCSFTMNKYFVWNGEAKKPAITVKDGDKTLVAGTDYSVAYSNNIKPGVGMATVRGLGDYASDDSGKAVKTLEFHIVKFQYRAKTSSLMGYVNLGKTSGSSSSSTSTCLKSLAAKVLKGDDSIDGGISYGVRTANKAWDNAWASNGITAKSDDLAQALRIKLTGEISKHYDVYYRVCIRSAGWLDWAKNGSAAGVVGIKSKLRVIGYQVKVLPKGSKAPGATKLSYVLHKSYETFAKHVLDKRIANVSSRTQYMISVDTTLNRVAIYKGKKGNWKRLHFWKCGTGKASTPSYKGDFTLKGTTYRIDSGKISYYYFKRYKKGLGFHSVTTKIYTRTLSRPLSAQLGHNLSHGCIRLTMENAKWVSELPRGTHVRIRGLV